MEKFAVFERGIFFFIESPHTDISIPSQINQQPNIVWSLSSGKAHFEPTAQDMYIVYESAIQPEHTKCAKKKKNSVQGDIPHIPHKPPRKISVSKMGWK